MIRFLVIDPPRWYERPMNVGELLEAPPVCPNVETHPEPEEGMHFLRLDLSEYVVNWWKENKVAPYRTGHTEGRWYPDSEGNRRFFKDAPFCLIPASLYRALDFPKPQGWEEKNYPWFNYTEAITALVKAIERGD